MCLLTLLYSKDGTMLKSIFFKADERITAISHFIWSSVNTSTGQLAPHSHSPAEGGELQPKVGRSGGRKPAEIPFLTSSHCFPSLIRETFLDLLNTLPAKQETCGPCGLCPINNGSTLLKAGKPGFRKEPIGKYNTKIFIKWFMPHQGFPGTSQEWRQDGTDSHLGSQIISDSWGKE